MGFGYLEMLLLWKVMGIVYNIFVIDAKIFKGEGEVKQESD